MNIKNIKTISNKYTSEQITECINHQLSDGSNICLRISDDLIGDLTKAEYIRKQMQNGNTQLQAIRDLASKIRKFA